MIEILPIMESELSSNHKFGNMTWKEFSYLLKQG